MPLPRSTVPSARAVLGLAAGLLCLALGVGLCLVGRATAGPPPDQRAPADPRTVVRVTGDAADGFGIHYLDGSARYPPTDSEARAECGEYDIAVARVRCRTEVRVWYRELAVLQAALRYAGRRSDGVVGADD